MLHVGTDLTAAVKTPESILKNKTQFTLMFPGKWIWREIVQFGVKFGNLAILLFDGKFYCLA